MRLRSHFRAAPLPSRCFRAAAPRSWAGPAMAACCSRCTWALRRRWRRRRNPASPPCARRRPPCSTRKARARRRLRPPAAPEPARAASGTVALQKEVEALREECKALERTTADVRAAMVALVAEVDALGAADKRAEGELNAAKARALAVCAAKGRRARATAGRDSGPRSRAHATAGAGGLRQEGAGPPEDA